MEKNKELRIVRGNDFIINMPVKNIVFLRDELGYTTKGVLPTDFANCKDIEVNLADGCGWYKPVEFVVKDDLLQIKIDGNIECGWYGVELRYVYEDVKYRSYERKVFKIVESNGGSYATPDVYEGELGYHIDAVWSLACVVDEVYLRSLVGTKSYERGSGENSAQQIGTGAQALGDGSHAEGASTIASGTESHAEGDQCVASGDSSHAEGDETIASGNQAHAEGHTTQAIGSSSHAEGKETEARGAHSHAEGYSTVAEGEDSHAEGHDTKAKGFASHAEGKSNGALGFYSHVEGEDNVAGSLEDERIGTCAHAEGRQTRAVGNYAHSEGDETAALGTASHAEGNNTEALGAYSHAEGHHTITNNKGEHACGRYNVSNTGENDADKTIFSVGIGNNTRKNGLEVRKNGDVYYWHDDSYVRLQDETRRMKSVPLFNSNGEPFYVDAKDNEYYNITGAWTSVLNVYLPDTYSEAHGEKFFINVNLASNPAIRFIPGGGYGGLVYAENGITIQPRERHEFCVKRISNTDWIVSATIINSNTISTLTPSGNPQTISEDEDILDTTE